MNFKQLINSNLLWGVHVLHYKKLISLINSYHSFYNNNIHEYIKYSGTTHLISFHCTCNESVIPQKWRISYDTWDLMSCAMVFNIKSVQHCIPSFNTTDFILLNQFNIIDLIKNNDIFFILPEEFQQSFIQHIKTIFYFQLKEKIISEKELLNTFRFKDKLYQDINSCYNEYYKNFIYTNISTLNTYTNFYKMLNDNIVKIDNKYIINPKISKNKKQLILKNFIYIFITSSFYTINFIIPENYEEINKYKFSNYDVNGHPYFYNIQYILDTMSHQDFINIFFKDNKITKYNNIIKYHDNNIQQLKPNITNSLLDYVIKKYKEIFNEDFPYDLKRSNCNNNKVYLTLEFYIFNLLLSNSKKNINNIDVSKLDIFYNKLKTIDAPFSFDEKFQLRPLIKKSSNSIYPYYEKYEDKIYKFNINYDSSISFIKLYNYIKKGDPYYFNEIYSFYSVRYKYNSLKLTIKYHVIKNILITLKQKHIDKYIRLNLNPKYWYNKDITHINKKYDTDIKLKSIIFPINNIDETLKLILDDNNYYTNLKNIKNIQFISNNDLYTINCSDKNCKKFVKIFDIKNYNENTYLSLKNNLSGNDSIFSAADTIKHKNFMPFPQKNYFMIANNILLKDKDILNALDNIFYSDKNKNENFIININNICYDLKIKNNIINLYKDICIQCINNQSLFDIMFLLSFYILYYENLFIYFDNIYHLITIIFLYIKILSIIYKTKYTKKSYNIDKLKNNIKNMKLFKYFDKRYDNNLNIYHIIIYLNIHKVIINDKIYLNHFLLIVKHIGKLLNNFNLSTLISNNNIINILDSNIEEFIMINNSIDKLFNEANINDIFDNCLYIPNLKNNILIPTETNNMINDNIITIVSQYIYNCF